MITYGPPSLHQNCSYSVPLAYVSNLKCFYKLGNARNGAWLIFYLRFPKDFCWFFSYWDPLLLVVMEWRDVATTKKEAIKFQRYCVAPQKILTSVPFVGVGNLMMASIFAWSILRSPLSITYPKYTKGRYVNPHFLMFSSSWCFFKVSNTCLIYDICSSLVAL